MSLYFKKCSFILWFLVAYPSLGQTTEDTRMADSTKTKVQARWGYIRPLPFGNHFVSSDYDWGGGFEVDFQFRLKSNFLIGVQYQNMEGKVIDEQTLNLFETSKWNRILLTTAYDVFPGNEQLHGYVGMGMGSAILTHQYQIENFKDDAFALMVNVTLERKLGKAIGLFLSLQQYIDFWNIEAPANQLQDYGTSFLFMPTAGVSLFF